MANALNRAIKPGEVLVLRAAPGRSRTIMERAFITLEGPGLATDTPGTTLVGLWFLSGRSTGPLDTGELDPADTRQFQQQVGRFPPPAPLPPDPVPVTPGRDPHNIYDVSNADFWSKVGPRPHPPEPTGRPDEQWACLGLDPAGHPEWGPTSNPLFLFEVTDLQSGAARQERRDAQWLLQTLIPGGYNRVTVDMLLLLAAPRFRFTLSSTGEVCLDKDSLDADWPSPAPPLAQSRSA